MIAYVLDGNGTQREREKLKRTTKQQWGPMFFLAMYLHYIIPQAREQALLLTPTSKISGLKTEEW